MKGNVTVVRPEEVTWRPSIISIYNVLPVSLKTVLFGIATGCYAQERARDVLLHLQYLGIDSATRVNAMNIAGVNTAITTFLHLVDAMAFLIQQGRTDGRTLSG